MSIDASFNRRDFLKMGAFAGAGAAVAGLAGCSAPAKTDSSAGSEPSGAASVPADIKPGDESAIGTAPEVADADVKETVSCDVLIVGAGITGIAAARSAAEAGAKVIVVEKKTGISIHGFQCASVNNSISKELIGEVDVSEILCEYQRRSVGRANMALASLWANYSGEVLDWYIEPIADEPDEMSNVTLAYYPVPAERAEANDMCKTFLGAIDFKEDPDNGTGSLTWIHLGEKSRDIAQNLGAEFRFSSAVIKLTTDESGKVNGGYVKDKSGAISKIEASKGVILCGGGCAQFGCGSEVMHKVYAPQMVKNYRIVTGGEPEWETMFELEPFELGGTTGDAQIMALWVGAAMDLFGDTAMGSCESGIGGTVALCVNQKGERFWNEDMGIWEKHDQVMNQPDRCCYDIIDVNWRDRLPYQAAGHRNLMVTDLPVAIGYTGPEYIEAFHEAFMSSVGKPEGVIPKLDPYAGPVFGANTLEELADLAGLPRDAFNASVERYNELVAQKKDDDFGCDPAKLFPIDTPPFFACRADVAPAMGAYLGLRANGKLQILSKEGDPIEGLWGAGNTVGMKFAPSYSTLMSGMNHGNCITHGYLAGLYAAQS